MSDTILHTSNRRVQLAQSAQFAWHFVGRTLRDGRRIPKDGRWLTHDGDLSLCKRGLHASLDPWDALRYAPGSTLCLVECAGRIIYSDDKVVCSRRRIVRRLDARDGLRYFARMRALSVLDDWDPPQVVLDYLMTGDEDIRAAALSAAARPAADRAAAREAARAAVAVAATAEAAAWAVAATAAAAAWAVAATAAAAAWAAEARAARPAADRAAAATSAAVATAKAAAATSAAVATAKSDWRALVAEAFEIENPIFTQVR